MKARHRDVSRRLVRWTIVVGIVTAGPLLSTATAFARSGAHGIAPSAVSPSPAASSIDERDRIDDLERRVNDLHDIVQLVLEPIAILIAILALGGALGVVFSFRDQRRLSQLHELAVGSEVSSQRRTELSYSSFLEESQKTLTLVNQTLALAREATEQAAHTMERKAEASLANIEADARELLAPLLDAGAFKGIVKHPATRSRLEAIAGELRAIEGYLLLQDIKLEPYSRFVKGMAQYLADDTSGAMNTLRQSAQDAEVRELQLFANYWYAYMNIALGRYNEAIHAFEVGEQNLPESMDERIEFDLMIEDTRFFLAAFDASSASPLERFNTLAPLLLSLEKLSDRARDVHSGRLDWLGAEIAEKRGDLLTWVAYDADALFRPIDPAAVTAARASAESGTDRLDGTLSIDTVRNLEVLAALSPEQVRAWCLVEASHLYGQVSGPESGEVAIAFGKAECAFLLADGEVEARLKSYLIVERAAIQEMGAHHEQRASIELLQVVLVCACRLLYLYQQLEPGNGSLDVRNEATQVKNTWLQVRKDLAEMRDQSLKLFSALQRRPLSRDEFAKECHELAREALGDDVVDL